MTRLLRYACKNTALPLATRASLLIAGVAAIVGLAEAAAPKEPVYASPEDAVAALIDTVKGGDEDAIGGILGPGSEALIDSGDPVADEQTRNKFLAAYDQAHKIERDGETRALLEVGSDDWAFPFPIVQKNGSWQFDSSAGAQEILDRRIGANELDAIEVCRAYVDAQVEYSEQDRNGDGLVEYAQQIVSSPGKHDGLYWPTAEGEADSPLGPAMASAQAEGYSTKAAENTPSEGGQTPYHGYYYRILKAQGPAAKDGATDYVVKGHMIGGFALVAFPAEYRSSGVMSFIVNYDGTVYQKDLGLKTTEIARKMKLFDPDKTWQAVPSS